MQTWILRNWVALQEARGTISSYQIEITWGSSWYSGFGYHCFDLLVEIQFNFILAWFWGIFSQK